jgi:hypothetical protein
MFSGKMVCQDLADVYVLDINHLSQVKQKIKEGNRDLTDGYSYLIRNAEEALQKGPYSVINITNESPSGDKHDYVSLAPYYWPDPKSGNGLPYIRKDGQRNPEVEQYMDRFYLADMAGDVEVLSICYFLSGDEKYAVHAVKLLKTFFLDKETRMNPNLNFAQAIKGDNQGRGAGLIESRHFIKVVESVKFLNGSKYWSADNEKQLKKWFAEFLNWMETSPNGIDEYDTPNNHGTWYDAQRLSYSLFLGEMESARKIVENAIQRLDKQMDNDGSFPKELERTIALHYSSFNLYAFFVIAEMAEKTNIDFWSLQTPSGKSLQKGFDYIYPFLSKEQKWKGQQIKPFDFREAAPLLFLASTKLNCTSCLKTISGLELKEDNLRILTLTLGK